MARKRAPNCMLKFTDDELDRLGAAFDAIRAQREVDDGPLPGIPSCGMHTVSNPYMALLLTDPEQATTTARVLGLLGLGIALAEMIGRRVDQGLTQSDVMMSAKHVKPNLILPGLRSRLWRMPLDEYLSLLEPDDAIEDPDNG